MTWLWPRLSMFRRCDALEERMNELAAALKELR